MHEHFLWVRAGPAKVLVERQIGYAPLNITYQVRVCHLTLTFGHGVHHAPTNKWNPCPLCLFLAREISPITRIRKNQKRPVKTVGERKREKKKGQGFSWFAQAVQIRGLTFQIETRKNSAVHRSIATHSRNYRSSMMLA